MLKEYEIKQRTITLASGEEVEKLFIYYYGGLYDGTEEYYGKPGQLPEAEIRNGYVSRVK
jgi:hypothetical protein